MRSEKSGSENGINGLSWCGDPRHVRPSRRDFLYVGLVGGLGLTLGNYFGATGRSARGEAKFYESKEGPANAVIHIFLPCGMSAQESFDPKPLAPIEYRGPLGTVPTKLPGEVFSELMAQTGQIADKITVVRSMTHGEAAHERGTHNMFTGYRPSPALIFPSMGSVVSHEYGPRNNLPPYVCIPGVPNEFAANGYLSSSFAPFSLGSDPANGGFDMHSTITQGMRGQMPALDQGLHALITDLDKQGLLKTTLIMVSSEFGRTPKINGTAGRDHWPKVFSVMLAGGGIKGGLMYG